MVEEENCKGTGTEVEKWRQMVPGNPSPPRHHPWHHPSVTPRLPPEGQTVIDQSSQKNGCRNDKKLCLLLSSGRRRRPRKMMSRWWQNQDASYSPKSKKRTRRTRRRCRLRRVRASMSLGQRTRRIKYHPFVKKATSTTKDDKHPHLTKRLLNHIFRKNKKKKTTRATDEPSHAEAQAEKKQLSHYASVSKNSAVATEVVAWESKATDRLATHLRSLASIESKSASQKEGDNLSHRPRVEGSRFYQIADISP